MLQTPSEQVQGPFKAGAHTRQRWIGPIKLTVLVGVACFLATRLSILEQAMAAGPIFWAAAGISSGTLVALGRDARLPVAVGTLAATVMANLMGGRNIWISSIFGVCHAGEALLLAWLIEHYLGRHFSLGNFRQVLGFLAAAIVATAVSAVGATVGKLIFNPDRPIWTTWWHWFLIDFVGVIAIAPFLIGLVAAVRVPPPRRELIEGAASVVAVVATTATTILLLPDTWWEMCLLVAVLFPLLLWPAARCRPLFASAAALAVCLTVVSALYFDVGHFNKANQPIEELVLNAHLTIVGVAVCALILASLFAERTETARRLQEALSAASVLTFEWDAHTDLAQRSDSAAQILGFDQRQLPTGASFNARLNPDDHNRYTALLNGLRRDNPSYSTTYRFTRPDGREVWLEDTAKAEFDTAGRLVRLKGLRVDVTARRQAEIRRDFLVAELDHRVKNALARVAAMATETGELSNSIDEFVKRFDGRLQSMSAAHALLSQSRWHGVAIADLIRDQLAPYATEANATIHGPNVTLTSATTEALAMVVHELVTNAAKHGALSKPGGRVSISWGAPSDSDGAASVIVEWREVGGPAVTKANRSGWGTGLIRELIPHELGGTVDLAFDPEGIYCRMRLPLGSS